MQINKNTILEDLKCKISTIKNCIDNSSRIGIFSHIHPDGDAIGSSLALKYSLEQLGKKADVLIADAIHENFSFMGTESIITEYNSSISYDLVFVLDCPEISRIGDFDVYCNNCKCINIDHHADNKEFADIIISNKNYSSTCLIVYNLIKLLNIKIDEKIATCLYTGIATDTGCFIHSNTDAITHIAAGELIDLGADFNLVNFKLFSKKTLPQVRLFALSLQNMVLAENNQIAIISLTQDMFKKAQATKEDAIGYVSYINGIDTVKFAIVIQEQRPNVYLVSIRSRECSAKNVANYYGGGGHEKAAGCKIFDNKENTIESLIKVCKEELLKNG